GAPSLGARLDTNHRAVLLDGPEVPLGRGRELEPVAHASTPFAFMAASLSARWNAARWASCSLLVSWSASTNANTSSGSSQNLSRSARCQYSSRSALFKEIFT